MQLSKGSSVKNTSNFFGNMNLPETNIVPKHGWLEDDPFLLAFGPFSGANCWWFRTPAPVEVGSLYIPLFFKVSYIPGWLFGISQPSGRVVNLNNSFDQAFGAACRVMLYPSVSVWKFVRLPSAWPSWGGMAGPRKNPIPKKLFLSI